MANDYTIVLKALLDEKSLAAQIKSINDSGKYGIDLKVNIDQTALNNVQAQISQIQQTLLKTGGGAGNNGIPLINAEGTIKNIGNIQDRLNALRTNVDKLATLDYSFDKNGQATRAILTYKNALGDVVKEAYTYQEIMEQVQKNGITTMQGTGKFEWVGMGGSGHEDPSAQIKADMALLQEQANFQNKIWDQNKKNSENAIAQADKFLEKSKMLSQSHPEVAKGIDTANLLKAEIATNGWTEKAKDLSKQLSVINEGVRTGGKNLQSWSTEVGIAIKRTIEWATGIGLVYGALNQLKQGIGYIADLDKEMTNIRVLQVDGAKSKEEIAGLAKSFNGLAKEMGVTTLEVAKGSVEWLRQGKSIQETQELVKSTAMLSKLGNIESAQATEYLTSTLNGYQLSAANAVGVVDKLVSVDNVAATSSAELAEALQKTANFAAMSGVSLDKMIGYIATVSSVTRKSAESIGTSFQSMFSRLENIKLGNLDEEGATINDVEKALAGVNIKLRDSTTSFRNMGDVLDEVASKWDSFNTIEKATVSQAVAGTRQRENFIVLMNNYGKALEYTKVAANSSGTALDRYQIYMESVEASQARMKSSWEKMWQTTINSDAIKFFYDLGTGALDAIDNMGGLVPVMTTVIGLIAVLNAQMVVNTVLSWANGFTKLRMAIGSLPTVIASFNSAIALNSSLTGAVNFAFGSAGLAGILTGLIPIIASVVAVWATWNKEITKTQQQGMNDVAKSWAQKFDNLKANGKGAKEVIESFRQSVEAINKTTAPKWDIKWNTSSLDILKQILDNSGALFVDKQKIIKEGLQGTIDSLDASKMSWSEYIQYVQEAAKAAGYSIDEHGRFYYVIKEGGANLRRYVDDIKYLDEAQVGLANSTTMAVDSWVTTWQKAGNQIKEVYTNLNSTLKGLMDEVASTNAIIEKQMDGTLGFTDIQKLLEVHPEYLSQMREENGLIKVNTDFLRQQNVQKAEDAVLAAKNANASAQEIKILQGYADQLKRGIPLSREFTETFDKLLVDAADLKDANGGLNDSFKALITSLGNSNKAYNQGELEASEYFKSINDGLKNLDFKKTFEGDKESAQVFFGGLTTNAVQALSQISSEFDAGNITLSEYTKSLEQLGEMFSTIGQFATDYSDSLGIVGAEADSMKSVVGEALTEIGGATSELTKLQETNTLMEQGMYEIQAKGLEFGTQAYNEFAAKLANAAAQSGVAIKDIQGNVLNGSNEILNFLTSAPENMGIMADQTANATGKSINKMVQAVGTLLVKLGESIKGFSAKIDFAPRVDQSKVTTVPIKILGMPVANFAEIPNMSLDVTGSSSSLSTIGQALTDFGSSLESSTVGTNFDRGIYKVPGQMNEVSNAGGKATDAIDDLNKSLEKTGSAAKDATKSMDALLKLVMDKIKQEKEAEKDRLKEQLDGYKKIINARKDLLKSMQEEADFQDGLADKEKDLAKIQAQMLELSLDDSEEARAKRLALADEEAKAKSDIAKVQRDHSTKAQEDALDKEFQAFEDITNEKIKAIDEYLKEPGRIATDAIALINEKSDTLYQDLINWNKVYGSGIDNDVTKAWNEAYDILDKYRNSLGQIDFQYATSQLANIQSQANQAVAAANNAVSAIAAANAAVSAAGSAGGNGGSLESQELNYNMDLNNDGKIGYHHSGVDSGFVGGLNSNEEFAKLMKGELVINPAQMNRFMNLTLPEFVRTGIADAGAKFDKLIELNVNGNLDQSVMPKLEEIANKVFEKFNQANFARGNTRNAGSFSI